VEGHDAGDEPRFPQKIVDAAIARDPSAGAAEYLAEFRTDVESFLSREVVDQAIVPSRFELPPVSGVRYVAFVDPSGGGSDSFTLAIAHLEKDIAILDAIREVIPPLSPEDVIKDFSNLILSYNTTSVIGDRYGGEFPREQFAKNGVTYAVTDKAKSDIYKELLPMMNSGKVELLENLRLSVQLISLERRTARGGRDSIDHPAGAHDDLANAAAGALVNVFSKLRSLEVWARL
jgi:hypothetical protein